METQAGDKRALDEVTDQEVFNVGAAQQNDEGDSFYF